MPHHHKKVINVIPNKRSNFESSWFIHDAISNLLFVFLQQLLDLGLVSTDHTWIIVDEGSNIFSDLSHFLFQVGNRLFHLSFLFLWLVVREPIDLRISDLCGNTVLETSVIAGIFQIDNIAIEDVVPKEMFEGMFLESLPYFFHLHKTKNTSGLDIAQM